MSGSTPTPRLPFNLAAAFTALVLYASLDPFTGWRDSGAPLFAWLTAAWPRYYTGFDLAVNVIAYLPLGFLWCTTLQARFSRTHAALLALLAALLIPQ